LSRKTNDNRKGCFKCRKIVKNEASVCFNRCDNVLIYSKNEVMEIARLWLGEKEKDHSLLERNLKKRKECVIDRRRIFRFPFCLISKK